MTPDPDDHRLAADLAERAGDALVGLRDRSIGSISQWALRDRGDQLAHDLIAAALAEHRPADILLSEEGAEDRRRLTAERCWIVDPLDGTYDYPFRDSIEWAVHVALVSAGRAIAAAVAVPGMDQVFATDDDATTAATVPRRPDRDRPIVVSGRSAGYAAAAVADELGAELTACGSAGVKAMLVVGGAVDVYVHATGLWEWDVCAPAAVAAAHGFTVTDIDGDEIVYNKARPMVRGLVVARPEYADATRTALDELRW